MILALIAISGSLKVVGSQSLISLVQNLPFKTHVFQITNQYKRESEGFRRAELNLEAVRAKTEDFAQWYKIQCFESYTKRQNYIRQICQQVQSRDNDVQLLVTMGGEATIKNQKLMHFRGSDEHARFAINNQEVDQILYEIQSKIGNYVQEIKSQHDLDHVLLKDKYLAKAIYISKDDEPPQHLKKLSVIYYEQIQFYFVNQRCQELLYRLKANRTLPTVAVLNYDFKDQKYKLTSYFPPDTGKFEPLKDALQGHLKQRRLDRLFTLQQTPIQIQVLKEPWEVKALRQRFGSSLILLNSKTHDTQPLQVIKSLYASDYRYAIRVSDQPQSLIIYDFNAEYGRSLTLQQPLKDLHSVRTQNVDHIKTLVNVIPREGYVLVLVQRKDSNFCSFFGQLRFQYYVKCLVIHPNHKSLLKQKLQIENDNQILPLVVSVKSNSTNKLQVVSPDSFQLKQLVFERIYQVLKNITNKNQLIIKLHGIQYFEGLCLRYTNRICLLAFVNNRRNTQLKKQQALLQQIAMTYYKEITVYETKITCNLNLLKSLGIAFQNQAYVLLNLNGFAYGNIIGSPEFYNYINRALNGFQRYELLPEELPRVNRECVQDEQNETISRDMQSEQRNLLRINTNAQKEELSWRNLIDQL